MARNRKCKVTVLKTLLHKDLAEEYDSFHTMPCQKFFEGQQFILDQNSKNGYWHLMGGIFCSEAWSSISCYIDTILQGG